MSSASGSASPGPAPWRASFLKNVGDMASPEFNLATLHPTSAPAGTVSAVPRLRTVIFRGLWASLPVNPKNTADLNPPVYESDLLTLTTDARMAKVLDFFGSAAPTMGTQGSGGGGPVEACFWTEAKVQWRVRGDAYVLGPDVEHDSPGAAALRETLLARMRRVSDADAQRRRKEDLPEGKTAAADGDWSFAREITAHFGNLSPAMRGTFRNPEPGASRKANPADDKHKLGQKVEDLHDEVARANFRVVVIVPTEVDQTDLSDAEDPRRWLYRFVGASADGQLTDGAERSSGWEKIELWP
ncbi:zn 2cys6 transcription factor [Colletotrichum incanum]|uniref:Zn 2cys6 transcription factor n=1 Tax=Colletotrichum incanum TaxID=1573173 RepID=A0A167DPE2_COLIC|nr:zn 2cys6 transcription factor [Colletotrichum incanum]